MAIQDPKNDPRNVFFGLFSCGRAFGDMVARGSLKMRTEGDLLEKTVCDYFFPLLRKIQKTRFQNDPSVGKKIKFLKS